jgi:uncharacterized membrane protein
MSIAELLILLVCGGGFLLVLAVGAWVLMNKSNLEQDASDPQSRLEALDRRYAAGELDEDDYDERRRKILEQQQRQG